MTGPPLVLTPDRVTPADLPLVGGKGVNLARLARLGQPVPPWYAVTTRAFRRALAAADLEARIARRLGQLDGASEAALAAAAEEIRGWILALEPPPEVVEALAETHARLLAREGFTAVRSSATAEDTAAASFAGLHDSFLFVRGLTEVTEAVKRVWASAFNPRALAYRQARGIPLDGIAIAVLVQAMIDARTSGVLFTADPTRGDVHRMVVSALWGAGEGLVSTGLDADTFAVDKETLEVEAEVARKEEQLVLHQGAGKGLERVPVPAELRDRPSLTDQQVEAVARAGLAIEAAFRRPQDVEFCLDPEGRLLILQARPVTTLEEDGPAAGHRLLWDNSNIIESYSGVTSPMTFSFIRHAYTIVYHCFAEVMGIRPAVVRAHRHTFETMLGLIRGQVYYNLRNWYRVVRLFPGYELNKGFMESMMGVRESASLEEEPAAPAGRLHRYFVDLPALIRLVARSTWNFLRIRRLVADFEAHFQAHYGRWSELDFAALAPHELMALYREMEDRLLWNWKTPIINDFFVMVFYGTLKKLCQSWCGDESGSLQNDLLCGEGDIASTQPTKLLLALARRASQDPVLEARLLADPPDTLAEEIPREARFADFAREVQRYLDLYGFRCVNELKLEEPSLKDRPAFLYQVLGNYLAMGDGEALDAEAAERRERRVRAEAEARAFAALARSRGLLPRRAIFRRVLANARLGVKNRENMRFARTRIYGLLRELLRALGQHFAREGVLARAEDVFYLTLDEVWGFIQGTTVTTDLRGLVELRRREFEGYRTDRDRLPDDRFLTFGMVCHRNRFKARQQAAAPPADGVLKGTGCCPGVVSGPVKVLRSPAEDARLAGEILVAERTDPGWVPLYPSVSGLLIERGSILSHSAIVAREMGLPTIVGIPGLTRFLETGQRVTLDGSAGTVKVEAEEP